MIRENYFFEVDILKETQYISFGPSKHVLNLSWYNMMQVSPFSRQIRNGNFFFLISSKKILLEIHKEKELSFNEKRNGSKHEGSRK